MRVVVGLIILIALIAVFKVLNGLIKLIRKQISLNQSFSNYYKYNNNENRKEAKRHYKKIYKQFNEYFIQPVNLLKIKPKKLFDCQYLIKQTMAPDLQEEHSWQISYYSNMNLREEALARIRTCLRYKYITKSAISYYTDRLYEINQIKLLIESDRNNVYFKSYFPTTYENRMGYLIRIIDTYAKLTKQLVEKEEKYDSAIKELSQLTKPTIFEIAWNVITAPIRRVFQLIDGILDEDAEKVIKAGSMILLGVVGAEIIGTAVDFLDGVDIDLDTASLENPNMHHVSAYDVDSYVRSDGTPVSGYHVEEHFQHNPDYKVKG